MTLSEITLHQFRTYQQRRFVFDTNLTVVTGRNGTGKTNLLEAVYTLLQGQSFRDSEPHLIQHAQAWWRLEGVIDGVERSVSYQTEPQTLKQLSIEGGDKKRFTRTKRLPVVLFEPDQLLLLHGSPGARRRYLDQVISNTDMTYNTLLNRYERILQQRNNILKKPPQGRGAMEDLLFAWDVPLIEAGVTIARMRQDCVARLNEHLSDIYSSIAGTSQKVEVRYESSLLDNGTIRESRFAAQLKQHLPADQHRGFTSVGPHRDDLSFHLNQQDASLSASRGEVRSIMYSLKRRELLFVEEATGSAPLFLMDDLYSELDEERQRAISQTIPNQTIITSTTIPRKLSQHTLIEL